jgi:hypothetical protein
MGLFGDFDLGLLNKAQEAIVALCERFRTATLVRIEQFLADVRDTLKPLRDDVFPTTGMAVDELRQAVKALREQTIPELSAMGATGKAMLEHVRTGGTVHFQVKTNPAKPGEYDIKMNLETGD